MGPGQVPMRPTVTLIKRQARARAPTAPPLTYQSEAGMQALQAIAYGRGQGEAAPGRAVLLISALYQTGLHSAIT